MKWKLLASMGAATLLAPVIGATPAVLDVGGTPNAVVPGVEVDSQNMHWIANVPQAVGSDVAIS